MFSKIFRGPSELAASDSALPELTNKALINELNQASGLTAQERSASSSSHPQAVNLADADMSFDPFDSPNIRRSKSMTISSGFSIPRKRSVQFNEHKEIKIVEKFKPHDTANSSQGFLSCVSHEDDNVKPNQDSENEDLSTQEEDYHPPATTGSVSEPATKRTLSRTVPFVIKNDTYENTHGPQQVEFDYGSPKTSPRGIKSACSNSSNDELRISTSPFWESLETISLTRNETLKRLGQLNSFLETDKYTFQQSPEHNDAQFAELCSDISTLFKKAESRYYDLFYALKENQKILEETKPQMDRSNKENTELRAQTEEALRKLKNLEDRLQAEVSKNFQLLERLAIYHDLETNFLQPFHKLRGSGEYSLDHIAGTFRRVLDEYERKLSEQSDVLNSQEEEKQALKSTVSKLRLELTEISSKSFNEREEFKAVNSTLKSQLEQESQSSQLQLKSIGDHNASLKKALEASEKRVQDLQSDISSLKSDLCKAEDALQRERAHSENRHLALQHEIKKSSVLTAQVGNLVLKVDELSESQEHDKSLIEREKTKSRAAMKENDGLQLKTKEILQNLELAQAETAELMNIIADLELDARKNLFKRNEVSNLPIKTLSKSNQILANALMLVFEESFRALSPMLCNESSQFFSYLLSSLENVSLDDPNGVSTLQRTVKFLLRALRDLVKSYQLNEDILGKILSNEYK